MKRYPMRMNKSATSNNSRIKKPTTIPWRMAAPERADTLIHQDVLFMIHAAAAYTMSRQPIKGLNMSAGT